MFILTTFKAVKYNTSYLLALGSGPLPDLQEGLIADHGFLSTLRRHLVLVKQKPQVLHTEGPKERERGKNTHNNPQWGAITSVKKYK